ncbi:MAG: hypothetical protein GXP57_00560 [Deltaproteobacteria bacterium]|nr:hypothetical protein [Deltaproteobacteria bacterium]
MFPHKMDYRSCINIFFLLGVLLLAGFTPRPCAGAGLDLHDISVEQTIEFYRQVPHLSREELAYGRKIIAGLDYNAQRIFRKMCRMPGMDFAKCKEAWAGLRGLKLSYAQVLAFEKWSSLPMVTGDLGLKALRAIQTMDHEACRSFSRYCGLPKMTPDCALKTIPLLDRFDDDRNRAAQGLFAVAGMNAVQALDSLDIIALLRDRQARAAAALAGVAGMNVGTLNDALPLIRQMSRDDAWNAGTLFSSPAMTRQEAWFWLVAYFANPPAVREKQFQTLGPERRMTLLRAFYDGGEELIWRINNLHAITDRFGFEISAAELSRYSGKQLQKRFEQLSPQVRSVFGDRFYQLLAAGRKGGMIAVLRRATAADRVETARNLTSTNIYALLAQGSELYDSSFRDILAPILRRRIEKCCSGNLLEFLHAVDPGNLLVSSFIVSLAQKGKLTAFFPENNLEQEQILDLVAVSAFKDENSIILFSATFMHLLEVLDPPARTFLIRKMSQCADSGSSGFTRLISVILQYYMREYPQLLSGEARSIIDRLVVRHGAIDLYKYLGTPFAQWKKDGRLGSISVFHADDDGRRSFVSFLTMLLKSGYHLRLSEQFTVVPMSAKTRLAAGKLIRYAQLHPARGLPRLFNGMQRICVTLVRRMDGLTISQAASVYSDEKNQELLIERFILGGTEMFAQRGHSYWRSEQITEPLNMLLKEGRLSKKDLESKQRFLSLGSCGGVKAYTRLSEMFLGHVDILATIGTGLAAINDPYNKNLFEVIARSPSTLSWQDISRESAFIFKGGHGRDYLQPGSLPAILHKILDEERKSQPDAIPGEKAAKSAGNPLG